MADREVHLEPEPDRPELSVVDEPEVALPPVPPTKGQRRTLMIVLAIIAAVVVYALAFDYTDVDLEQARNKRIERTVGAHVIDRFADRRPEFYGPIVTED